MSLSIAKIYQKFIKNTGVFTLILMVACSTYCFSEDASSRQGSSEQENEQPQSFHLRASIREDLLNSYFEALVPVSGHGEHDAGFMKQPYTWKINKVITEIEPDRTLIRAQVDIDIAGIKSPSDAEGKLTVSYDEATNHIVFNVESFFLDINIELFGNKIKLATVDLSQSFSPQFKIQGPVPSAMTSTIQLPEGETVHIKTTPKEFLIESEHDYFSVLSTFAFETVENADENSKEISNESNQADAYYQPNRKLNQSVGKRFEGKR